jgi:hypothetical protein
MVIHSYIKAFLLFLFFGGGEILYCQSLKIDNNEFLRNLTDSSLIKEIAFLRAKNFDGKTVNKDITLLRMPAHSCRDTSVYFEIGNIKALILSVKVNIDTSKKRIETIRFDPYKGFYLLPDSSYHLPYFNWN